MKKIFANALLLLITLIVPVYSQELSELKVADKGKIIPGELIDKKIRDANGEVCAGLMIVSDLDGFTYSSYDHVVKINKMPGKDLLFLSPEERVVEVYKSGFKPLKIILNEYGVRLSPGKVWQMEVTGKKADSISINIIPSVADVKIFIDSVDMGINNTQLVTAGRHTLRLEKAGYKTFLDTINVSPSNILFNYKLEEIELIPVQITSVPAGARILINNVDHGETDKGLFLMPGGYKLKLLKPGYKEAEDTIEINDKSLKQFAYNLKLTAAILIPVLDPSDANVLINKNDYTGQKEIILTPGIYRIEVSKPGYYSVHETITIKLAQTLRKNFTLKEKTGSLQFTVQPLNAEVKLLLGSVVKYSWQGMKYLKEIQEGEYNLECSLKGYNTVNKSVIIKEGKTTREEITLSKEVLYANKEDNISKEKDRVLTDNNPPEETITPVQKMPEEENTPAKDNTDARQSQKRKKDSNPRTYNPPSDEQSGRSKTYHDKSGFGLQLGVSYGLNFSSVSGTDIPDITNSSSGRGTVFGALIDINFDEALGLLTTLQFKDTKTIFTSEEFTAGDASNQEFYTLETNMSIEYLTVEPLLKLSIPGTGIYFIGGPSFSLGVKGIYELKLISANRNNVFSNGTNEQTGDLQNLNRNFSLKAGVGVNINLGNIALTPQVTYDYSMSEVAQKYFPAKVTTIQAVLALKLIMF